MMEERNQTMSRREALKTTSLLIGFSISASAVAGVLAGCRPEQKGSANWRPVFFSKDQLATVSEIAEVLLPATSTPGAKELKLEQFIDFMLKDYYAKQDQITFLSGLEELDSRCKKDFGSSFLKCGKADQHAIVMAYDLETKEFYRMNNQKDIAIPFFRILKELTFLGYFTSERIGKEYLAYDPIPGVWTGCIPLSDVGKAWTL
jgi:hypothetical protein